MRILAIRGKNLASLADEFEILLTDGVLQNVGLFAITGQTGAGKSTILDALCLALYDKMPRLPSGEGFAVGHKDEDESQHVKHNDVRSILRRGASQAYAEVDFIGKDKQAYRARWQVSKARGKASGKLQAQEMLLNNIVSGQRLGQTKTSTLEAISELIGLNFEQFRRSVLLAQGDFAAFLKAKKDERSSLLERITGTELYSSISIAAFERAKQEKIELDKIKASMAHQLPLNVEMRQDLEQQRALLTTQLSELDSEITANQTILDWYAELKKRQTAEQLASDVLAEKSQAWNAAEPLRDQLKQIEAAEPLRPLLNYYQTAQAEHDHAQQKLKSTLELQAAIAIKHQQATAQLTEQSKQFNIAERNHTLAQPVLKNIRALDTRLEVLQTTLNTLNAEEKQLQADLSSAQTQQNALLTQQTEHGDTAQSLTLWLTKNQNLTALAADWTYWDSELKRYDALLKQRNQESEAVAKIEQGIRENQPRFTELQTDIDSKKQQLHDQQTALDTLKQQDTAQSLTQLYQHKAILEQENQQLNTALNLVKQALELQQAITQNTHGLTTAQKNLETASEQHDNFSRQQIINGISLDEAKKALALIEATTHKDAAQLRSLLIDHQPCPVCGALEHPLQNHAVQLGSQQAQAQQQRVHELENEKVALIKNIAQSYQTIEYEKNQVTELNKQLISARETSDKVNDDWNALVFNNKPAFALHDVPLLPLLNQHHERVTAELSQLKQQEQAALDLQQQLKAAQDLVNDIQKKTELLTNEHAALDKQLLQHQTESRAHSANIETLDKQLNALIDALAVPCQTLENWQTYLATPASLRKKVQQFQQTQQELLTLNKNLETVQQQVQLTAQTCQQVQQQLAQKQTASQRETKQQQALTAERVALMSDYYAKCNDKKLTADALEQFLNQNLSEAKTAQQQATNTLNTLTIELSNQNNQQQHWQQETNRRAEQCQQALNALNLAVEKLAMTHQQLSDLLQVDKQWLTDQKNQLEQLENALQAATTALNIKTEERKQHESHALSTTEDDAKQTATQLQQQKQQLGEQKQECDLQLREDDKKIAGSRDIKVELDKQQHRWEQWQSLNDLIGSSTGSKFRVFAQSLTLEALLQHSNKHLADFAKRYVLQRVPSSDLELQIIDRDMADDVRSVHSLSGGESFLVSLALALGLASLSSNKTQVESLFIDEGFGSLDPETLDIAIASLDTLQALGRKVAVISHVPILVERIGAKVVVEKQGGGKSRVTVVQN